VYGFLKRLQFIHGKHRWQITLGRQEQQGGNRWD
jgi:hypothetical protein